MGFESSTGGYVKGAEKVVLIGALVVGAIVVVRRKSSTSTSTAPKNDVCASLSGDLKTACEAAQSVLGIGGAILNSIDDEGNNRKANGGVKKSIPKPFLDAHPGFYGTGSNTVGAVVTSTDLEYANGCVPYASHPGFAKCAPGTVPLDNGNYYDGGWFGTDSHTAQTAALGTGSTRGDDPLTIGPLKPGDPGYRDPGPGKEIWWVAGVLQVVPACPSGRAVDQRTGGAVGTVDAPMLPPCFGPATTDRNGQALTPQPPQMTTDDPAPTGKNSTTGATGYVWVTSPPPPHWERKR